MAHFKDSQMAYWLILLLILVACRPTDGPTTAAADGDSPQHNPQGTLQIALPIVPNSLDLATASERNAENVAAQIFDSLIWINDAGEKVPALAESWEVDASGAVYTFYLRQGVTFHNGERFDADAVVFSWQRGRQPGMQWRDRWSMAANVEKIDDYTIRITTSESTPIFLAVVAQHWGIVPPGYVNKVGDEAFGRHPIGTGPFVFESWTDEQITLRANTNYWQPGRPIIRTLIFHPMPDAARRAEAARSGQVDIATRLERDDAQNMGGLLHLDIRRYTVDRVYYIAFNNLTSGIGQPTEDRRVRLAMNLAIDRQVVIDDLFDGFARLSTGLITPGNLGYDQSLAPLPFDRQQAAELLQEAGYPDGFAMDMSCPIDAYPSFENACTIVADQLAEIGIDIRLEFMEANLFWEKEAAKMLPPLFGDSWSESSGEALPRLNGALGGRQSPFAAWSDPQIDTLLTEIVATQDDAERAAVYSRLHRLMLEDPPFIYLYEPITFEAVSTGVLNYRPRAAENYYLKDVSLKE